jgi:hypothetical protein
MAVDVIVIVGAVTPPAIYCTLWPGPDYFHESNFLLFGCARY